MISSNPLFQILFTSGNKALAAAGTRPDELTPGQLGFFDYNTGLAVTAANAKTTRQIFIAVGKSTTGSTTTSNNIAKSAAEYILVGGIQSAIGKEAVAPVAQILTYNIGDIKPLTDYGIKLEIRNQEAYANYGYNVPSKIFTTTSGPEEDLATGLASTEDLIDDLVAMVNADPENQDSTPLLVATKVDADTFTIAINPMAMEQYAGVNLKYANPRGTLAIPSLIGFEENPVSPSTVTETQAMVYAQGSGYDLRELEYEAGGWNGNPGIYRNSDVTGFERGISEGVATAVYDTFSIGYINKGVGGGLEYGKSLLTIIACGAGETSAKTALNTFVTGLNGVGSTNVTVD